ncbi:MAG: hypothetical protein GXO64_00020 [Candidatus Micrarchaeota archaeon]|nr:hypothetical protein [Candidatus Micrarchaeota archaeon]
MAENETEGGFQNQQRRLPFREKSIDSITQDDIKVRFVGMVIEKKGDTLIVDDGTGQMKVVVENAEDIDINSKIRIFGRVIPTDDGAEISGEIVQDFSEADMNVYRRLVSEEKSLGV